MKDCINKTVDFAVKPKFCILSNSGYTPENDNQDLDATNDRNVQFWNHGLLLITAGDQTLNNYAYHTLSTLEGGKGNTAVFLICVQLNIQ